MEQLNKKGASMFTKLGELPQNEKMAVKCLKFKTGRFGTQLTAELVDGRVVYLPDRYKDIEQTVLDEMNTKERFYLVYRGMKSIANGKTMHLLEFME